MKKCSKCGQEKDLKDFVKDKRAKTGYTSRCKECQNKAASRYRKDNPEKVKESKDKYKEHNRKAINDSLVKYAKHNKEKKRAHGLVQKALEKGTLIKAACESCGKLEAEAHHEDYTKPLEVIWLCRYCHKQRHTSLIAY